MDYTKATADEITQHASDIGEARRAENDTPSSLLFALNAEAAILTNAIEALCRERDRLARHVAALSRKVEELDWAPEGDEDELVFKCDVDGGHAWAIWSSESQTVVGAFFGGVHFEDADIPRSHMEQIEAAVKRHLDNMKAEFYE